MTSMDYCFLGIPPGRPASLKMHDLLVVNRSETKFSALKNVETSFIAAAWNCISNLGVDNHQHWSWYNFVSMWTRHKIGNSYLTQLLTFVPVGTEASGKQILDLRHRSSDSGALEPYRKISRTCRMNTSPSLKSSFCECLNKTMNIHSAQNIKKWNTTEWFSEVNQGILKVGANKVARTSVMWLSISQFAWNQFSYANEQNKNLA